MDTTNSITKIPDSSKKLFWDMDKEKLDLNLHKKSIIERIINYGVLADWRWLSLVYGKSTITDFLRFKDKVGRENIRPSALSLASILFK